MNFENWIPIIYEPKNSLSLSLSLTHTHTHTAKWSKLRLNRTKYIAKWLYYQFNKCTPTFSRFRVFVLSQLSVFSPLSLSLSLRNSTLKFHKSISQFHRYTTQFILFIPSLPSQFPDSSNSQVFHSWFQQFPKGFRSIPTLCFFSSLWEIQPKNFTNPYRNFTDTPRNLYNSFLLFPLNSLIPPIHKSFTADFNNSQQKRKKEKKYPNLH